MTERVKSPSERYMEAVLGGTEELPGEEEEEEDYLYESLTVELDVEGVNNDAERHTYYGITNVFVGDIAGSNQPFVGEERGNAMRYLFIEHEDGISSHKSYLVRGWDGWDDR